MCVQACACVYVCARACIHARTVTEQLKEAIFLNERESHIRQNDFKLSLFSGVLVVASQEAGGGRLMWCLLF